MNRADGVSGELDWATIGRMGGSRVKFLWIFGIP